MRFGRLGELVSDYVRCLLAADRSGGLAQFHHPRSVHTSRHDGGRISGANASTQCAALPWLAIAIREALIKSLRSARSCCGVRL